MCTCSIVGLSARAIAGAGQDHPWDPSDLLRCVSYCKSAGISTTELQRRMAGRSPAWDLLLPHWEALVTLMQEEIDTRRDDRAPRTYTEMKRVLADGIACTACVSSGRGAPCPKCKGSGSRSGGRCRAENCFRGAELCATCQGRGFTTKEMAA